MPQISPSSTPSSRPPAVPADGRDRPSATADGFQSLLAEMLGIAMPAPLPPQAPRPIIAGVGTNVGAAADRAPNAAGAETATGEAGAAPSREGRAAAPSAGETPPATGRAGDASPAGPTLPPGAQPDGPRRSDGPRQSDGTGRPDGAVQPEAAAGVTDAAAEGGNPVRSMAEQTMPGSAMPGSGIERPQGEAGKDSRPSGQAAASDVTRVEQLRIPGEPATGPAERLARHPTGERPNAVLEAIQQAKAPADPAAVARTPLDNRAIRPEIALRPAVQGPSSIGSRPGFARLALPTDWSSTAEVAAPGGLAAAPAGAGTVERAALASAATTAAGAMPAAQQVAAAIGRAAGGDLRHLTIQLTPKALGTIEIALEFDGDRRLGVVILAERPETLELLRGESRDLQRLLAQQGIDLSDAGLEFDLMDGERRQGRSPDGEPEAAFDLDAGGADAEPREQAVSGGGPEPPGHALVGHAGRLNLSI